MNSSIKSGFWIFDIRKALFLLFIAILATVMHTDYSYAEVNNTEFVDLVFTVDSKFYFSKSLKKPLDAAPFIENGNALVPFRVILEELGYNIEWNSSNSTITALSENSKIQLRINNNTAFVNDEPIQMAVAPKIIGGRTVVPLRFVSENSGANVVWDAKTKSIYITRVGKYDTGAVLFYEKDSKNNNKLYIYDGEEFRVIPMVNKEIVNWYSYKGKILITLFDNETSKNNFVMFENDDFKMLIDDFDIEETFEYNDNLIIHGYDRNQKFNKLYRFDGENLIMVEDNFYVGKHIEFKDKLLINKYDNNRDYYLLAFDKNSATPWKPSLIYEGFIIKDSIVHEDTLFMTGTMQEGNRKPLAAFDGKGTDKRNFQIIHPDVPVNINDIAVYRRMLFAIVDGSLNIIENQHISEVVFPIVEDGASEFNFDKYIKYKVNKLMTYNDRLYIGVLDGKMYTLDEKTRKYRMSAIADPQFVMEFEDIIKYNRFIEQFKLTEFRNENNKLFILGTKKTGNTFTDPILFAYNGDKLVQTMDVLSIKKTLSIKDKIFFDIKDKSRITEKQRPTLMIFEKDEFRNLAVDMEMKNWECLNDNLVFSGYEADIKRSKLYSFSSDFNELLSNCEVKYWNMIQDMLFVSGYDSSAKLYDIYKFTDDKLTNIKSNSEAIKVIKAKGNFYLVYAYERDGESPLKGKKILYIFDGISGDFIEMKVNIQLTDMIFIE